MCKLKNGMPLWVAKMICSELLYFILHLKWLGPVVLLNITVSNKREKHQVSPIKICMCHC